MDEVRAAQIRAAQAEKIKQITDLMQKLGVTTESRMRLDPQTNFIEHIVVFLVVDNMPTVTVTKEEPKPETPTIEKQIQ